MLSAQLCPGSATNIVKDINMVVELYFFYKTKFCFNQIISFGVNAKLF